MKNLFNKSKLALVGLLSFGAVGLASATGGPASPDLTSMVPDFTTVTTAVLAVAAAIVGVYVTWKGAKILINAVKGA